MASSTNSPTAPVRAGPRWWTALVELALVAAVFAAHGAWPVPDVNETHYLTKARRFWEPDWLPGDFFLNTSDAHVVFYATAGWVARVVPLPTAAWVGRGVTWLLLAWAWWGLTRAVTTRWGCAVAGAALFVSLVERCHMAGEWVVGGFEAKGLAYALVLLALRQIALGQWVRCWLTLGAASALHVLVGGWSTLASLVALWREPAARPSARALLGSLALGLLLALPGLLPTLPLLVGDECDGQRANAIYVVERLPHHLLPATFPPALLVRHAALVVVWFVLARSIRGDLPLTRVMRVVGAAVGITICGAVISLLMPLAPALVQSLLRLYFFRLGDVLVPLGVALAVVRLGSLGALGRPAKALLVVGAVAIVAFHVVQTAAERRAAPAGRADTVKRVADVAAWHDVCEWIRHNTPPDSVFLAPRSAQTFRWHAERAELVNWKDIPQADCDILAWWEQHGAIHGTGHAEDRWYDWLSEAPTEHVLAVSRRYGATHVLTRAVPRLALPRVYVNNQFAVYVVPPSSESAVP